MMGRSQPFRRRVFEQCLVLRHEEFRRHAIVVHCADDLDVCPHLAYAISRSKTSKCCRISRSFPQITIEVSMLSLLHHFICPTQIHPFLFCFPKIRTSKKSRKAAITGRGLAEERLHPLFFRMVRCFPPSKSLLEDGGISVGYLKMDGRNISFLWDGLFSGAMLVSVCNVSSNKIQLQVCCSRTHHDQNRDQCIDQ